MVRQACAADRVAVGKMRALLWPGTTAEEHSREFDLTFEPGRSGTLPLATFVSTDDSGQLTGFLEAGLRSHADGCDPARPVGFIEGWFVQEEFRHRGIGRDLVLAAEAWARALGCREMASDTWIDQEGSQRAHQALGYEVVDRCVHFRKML